MKKCFSHISRIDLIGKDAIVLRDGQQVTEFQEGILPWALQNPVALVFDEYDAGRPDVMFVIQRVLEVDGKLTLLDRDFILHVVVYLESLDDSRWRAAHAGHGDVHALMKTSNTAQEWLAKGIEHVFFFQDTNPLVLHTVLPALGVSRSRNFAMNSVCVPSRGGEAAGAITKLASTDSPAFLLRLRDGASDRPPCCYGTARLTLPLPLWVRIMTRRIEQHLAAADGDAVGFERSDDVAHADRTEQLTGFGRLTEHDDVAAVDLLDGLVELALAPRLAHGVLHELREDVEAART